jgi:hypothetical protein
MSWGSTPVRTETMLAVTGAERLRMSTISMRPTPSVSLAELYMYSPPGWTVMLWEPPEKGQNETATGAAGLVMSTMKVPVRAPPVLTSWKHFDETLAL